MTNNDPWGSELPPAVPEAALAPLPSRLADLAALTGRRPLAAGERWEWPAAAELPEVQALAAQGWRPLDGSPVCSCLPAVWPVEHRCWVVDRLPRVSVGECFTDHQSGDYQDRERPWQWVRPLDAHDLQDLQEFAALTAAEAGLPPPPPRRLWLLRSPWPTLGMTVVLGLLGRRCRQRRLPDGSAGLTEAARELLAWPQERVWAWWSGPDADAARAWRGRGRIGEEVADLVVSGLGPAETALLGADAAGMPGLTEAQAVAWSRAVARRGREALETIRAWRALGLPPDPPPDPWSVLARVPPARAASWLAAGFDLADIGKLRRPRVEEAGKLRRLQLEEAIAWRARGFSSLEVMRLLCADWTLTPEEGAAFVAAGIGEAERLRWVEDGFDATAARAWTDLGVLPGEARVWRSVGKGPQDARAELASGGGRLPPEAVDAGWTAFGSARAGRRYGVVDPPGTRGRTAAEPAETAAWRRKSSRR